MKWSSKITTMTTIPITESEQSASLSLEILDLLRYSIHEKRRDEIVEGVQQARLEHKEGKSQAYNADALRAE
jgi:hypothetical protein